MRYGGRCLLPRMMSTHLKKLKKLANFFEKKEWLSVIDLKRASNNRNRSERESGEFVNRKNAYHRFCSSMLTGVLRRSELDYIEYGNRYFDLRGGQLKQELDKNIAIEDMKREFVIRAAVKRRIWENIVSRSADRLKKRENAKAERVSDDLALIHSHLDDSDR